MRALQSLCESPVNRVRRARKNKIPRAAAFATVKRWDDLCQPMVNLRSGKPLKKNSSKASCNVPGNEQHHELKVTSV
jgi:hypothetical protein